MDFDIAIIGAGPVGLSCALFLARHWPHPARIALFDQKPVEAALEDPRVLALSYGSRQLLQRIHAWPQSATPIHTIHISQRGHLGRTLIRHIEEDVPALGYVTAYGTLCQTLHAQLRMAGVTCLQPCYLQHFTEEEDGVTLHTNTQTYRAALLVHAEGMPADGDASSLQQYDYQQHAVLGFVKSSGLAAQKQIHTAFERFTLHGPLALLPHRQQDQMGYSLVWCCPPEQAAALLQMNQAERLTALQHAFGQRVGQFGDWQSLQTVPLVQKRATQLATARTVRIGNAAQTLHPVAGQGFNLGLRDAYELAQQLIEIQPTITQVLQPSTQSPSVFARYTALRQLDRVRVLNTTHHLAIDFTQTAGLALPCAAQLRGQALLGLDSLPRVRRLFAASFIYGSRA